MKKAVEKQLVFCVESVSFVIFFVEVFREFPDTNVNLSPIISGNPKKSTPAVSAFQSIL